MEKCPTCGAVKKKPGLSKKQLEVLKIISAFIQDNGYSPSLEELAILHGTARSNVYRHIQRLIDRGYIVQMPFRKRALAVI